LSFDVLRKYSTFASELLTGHREWPQILESMPAKIRLQRQGRKRSAFYHIVVADARAKRDGRSIERIGSYNPNTNPATITLDVDKAVSWLEDGAQPTDTAKAILSYKGALMKKHLNGGVRKGAFDQAEADKRFDAWLVEKEGKIEGKTKGLSDSQAKAAADALAAEKKVNEERIAKLAEAEAAIKAEEEAANAEAEAVTEEATEEVATEEAPAAEEKTEE
jgi:small subunit ribosomal protein S16